ncbi:MAG: hypothetical protein HQL78_05555 [Magnetococcales bacterium]|nr:hypothetical protein [Magnetococcales bacterium]
MIPIEDPIPFGNAIRILLGIELYPGECINRDRVNFIHVYGLFVNTDKAQLNVELYHGNTYVNLLSFLEWTARHETFKQYAIETRFVYPVTLIKELQEYLSKEFSDTAEAFQKNARLKWLNDELSKTDVGSTEYSQIRGEIESLTQGGKATAKREFTTHVATETRQNNVSARRSALKKAVNALLENAKGTDAEFTIREIPYPKQQFFELIVQMRSQLITGKCSPAALDRLKEDLAHKIPTYLDEDSRKLGIRFLGAKQKKPIELLKTVFYPTKK